MCMVNWPIIFAIFKVFNALINLPLLQGIEADLISTSIQLNKNIIFAIIPIENTVSFLLNTRGTHGRVLNPWSSNSFSKAVSFFQQSTQNIFWHICTYIRHILKTNIYLICVISFDLFELIKYSNHSLKLLIIVGPIGCRPYCGFSSPPPSSSSLYSPFSSPLSDPFFPFY